MPAARTPRRAARPARGPGDAGASGRRPLAVLLVALEKAVSTVALAAGVVLALILHSRGGVNPLQFLFPGEMAEVPRDAFIRWLAAHVPSIGPGMTLVIAVGLAFWSVLLGLEAVGLWLGLGWGEFLVILETGCFLPVEIWDIVRHPRPTGFVTLIVNLAILVYVGGLYRRRLRRRAAAARAAALDGGDGAPRPGYAARAGTAVRAPATQVATAGDSPGGGVDPEGARGPRPALDSAREGGDTAEDRWARSSGVRAGDS